MQKLKVRNEVGRKTAAVNVATLLRLEYSHFHFLFNLKDHLMARLLTKTKR
jgi:hypothetical protein